MVKNAILIILGAFLFMALPGLIVWYTVGPGRFSIQKSSETVAERDEAIDDAFGSRRSSKPDPDNSATNDAKEVATPSDDDDAPDVERELTKVDRDNIEELGLNASEAQFDSSISSKAFFASLHAASAS